MWTRAIRLQRKRPRFKQWCFALVWGHLNENAIWHSTCSIVNDIPVTCWENCIEMCHSFEMHPLVMNFRLVFLLPDQMWNSRSWPCNFQFYRVDLIINFPDLIKWTDQEAQVDQTLLVGSSWILHMDHPKYQPRSVWSAGPPWHRLEMEWNWTNWIFKKHAASVLLHENLEESFSGVEFQRNVSWSCKRCLRYGSSTPCFEEECTLFFVSSMLFLVFHFTSLYEHMSFLNDIHGDFCCSPICQKLIRAYSM